MEGVCSDCTLLLFLLHIFSFSVYKYCYQALKSSIFRRQKETFINFFIPLQGLLGIKDIKKKGRS